MVESMGKMKELFDAVNYFVEAVKIKCYNLYISKQRNADNTLKQ